MSPDEDAAPGQVTVLGLGAMGLEMAVRLSSSFAVTGYDPSPECAERAVGRGLRLAPSPEEAARDASTVVLAVRTLDHARETLFGPRGAAGGAPPGAVFVLTSTVGVAGAQAVAAELADRQLALLDLPVSGGPRRAGAGDLLVFAGGSDEVLQQVRPVVEHLSSTVARAGSRPGDGQAMKTVNQLLCGVHVAAAAEALALARSLGLDPVAVLDALGAGAAASFMLADRGPRVAEALAGATPQVRSRMDIFVKDMGIVLDAGRVGGVATPVAAAAEQLFRIAATAGLADQDDSTVATLLR